MDFKPFWQNLAAPQRKKFADDIGTSVGYCHQIAFGGKRIELGLADAMVAQSGGQLTHDELPLTDRARFHRASRTTPAEPDAAPAGVR